ncbi:CRISPR-associated endonuclease Cas2 [Magnetospira sp. QH-2]|uniref:CRISPR-associated endonuclease Cas2 n=1 Tax=Magnetospira sp. (strain QH-2) TaxID=1288970 RepID=UPI0003E8142E|nr:CRISPR-associated endonuclease Cas2 [Magnetospira sp. QH-2]CCQ74038.1 CRISPR-associated protein Cas2 [Magnetospira sp. QH-2]
MLVLISYDVETTDRAGRRRLRRIAKACQDHGQRVQFSVFECEVTPAAWTALRARLLDEMDPKKDSLRFYFLGAEGKRRIEHQGNRVPLDLEGPLLL